jgi:hypothetical protein
MGCEALPTIASVQERLEAARRCWDLHEHQLTVEVPSPGQVLCLRPNCRSRGEHVRLMRNSFALVQGAPPVCWSASRTGLEPLELVLSLGLRCPSRGSEAICLADRAERASVELTVRCGRELRRAPLSAPSKDTPFELSGSLKLVLFALLVSDRAPLWFPCSHAA